MRPWLLALVIHLTVSGAARWLQGAAGSPREYFRSISISMLAVLLMAVVIAVWQERTLLAGSFVVISSSLVALLFYQKELLQQLSLALGIVFTVAVVSWLLAALGNHLQRRMRAME
ncbi:MAG: hypothetical protein ACOX2K_05710 [Bacillota bacterium]|jgi:cell division protein FtsW (lipid II flippase)